MSSIDQPQPATPGELPPSPDEVRAREDALASSLVETFVQTRASKAELDAFEITTLSAAAALILTQTDRLNRRSSAAEIPERAMVAELALAAHASERTVRRQLEEAADLCARFDATVAALRQGRISRTHVSVIHEGGHAIENPDARAEYERAAIGRAETMTAGRLRPIVHVLAARFNPRTIDERHAAARETREVRVVDLVDGMAQFIATIPATLAYGALDRLTQQAQAVIAARPSTNANPAVDSSHAGRAADRLDTDPAVDRMNADNGVEDAAGDSTIDDADTRSLDELRSDIFADLLLTGTPQSCVAGDALSAIRATVQIMVPVLTAAGRGADPAVLAGHGPVDADTARRLAGAAHGWDRVMTSPVTGSVLAVDRYRPGEELRRFLRARDEHCRFPGCRMPVSRCDIDHTHDAALGGTTSESNLAHLCRGHHTLKHSSEWRVKQLGGGVLEWTSPSGRTYADHPEPTLRFTPSPEPEPPSRANWFTAPPDDPIWRYTPDGDPPEF